MVAIKDCEMPIACDWCIIRTRCDWYTAWIHGVRHVSSPKPEGDECRLIDPEKQEKDKWTPIAENPKKPKYQFDTYLVYTKYERFGIADYFGSGGWSGYDVDGDQLDELGITAWMPLPEPYQEDKA